MKFDKNILFFVLLFCVGLVVARFITSRVDEKKLISNENTSVKRIICLNPGAVEVIYALGQEGRIVGVSTFCEYPEQVKDKPKVGDSVKPNLERIRVLAPELVIVMGRSENIVSFCRAKGIEVMNMHMQTIGELYEDIEKLSAKLGCEDKGARLVEQIQAELDDVRIGVAGLERKKVFFSLYRNEGSLAGISTVGAGTMLGELIEIAGGVNVFGDVEFSYPKISKESLLVLNPEVIIEPSMSGKISAEKEENALQLWSQLNTMSAVKDGQIYFPDGDLLFKPGPRIGKAAKVLSEIIHPEVSFD